MQNWRGTEEEVARQKHNSEANKVLREFASFLDSFPEIDFSADYLLLLPPTEQLIFTLKIDNCLILGIIIFHMEDPQNYIMQNKKDTFLQTVAAPDCRRTKVLTTNG